MSVALAAIGAGLFLLLGTMHGILTLQSKPDRGPMMPTDPHVRAAMSEVGGLGLAPELRSTLYKAWIGFNYSHSLGVVAVAGIVLWHVIDDFAAAVDQAWFIALIVAAPISYFVLAVKYWFAKPRDGIALGTLLIWAGVAVELFS